MLLKIDNELEIYGKDDAPKLVNYHKVMEYIAEINDEIRHNRLEDAIMRYITPYFKLDMNKSLMQIKSVNASNVTVIDEIIKK